MEMSSEDEKLNIIYESKSFEDKYYVYSLSLREDVETKERHIELCMKPKVPNTIPIPKIEAFYDVTKIDRNTLCVWALCRASFEDMFGSGETVLIQSSREYKIKRTDTKALEFLKAMEDHFWMALWEELSVERRREYVIKFLDIISQLSR